MSSMSMRHLIKKELKACAASMSVYSPQSHLIKKELKVVSPSPNSGFSLPHLIKKELKAPLNAGNLGQVALLQHLIKKELKESYTSVLPPFALKFMMTILCI